VLVNAITLETKKQLWLLDDVLPKLWLNHVHNICDKFVPGCLEWPQPDWCVSSGNRPRYIFNNQGDDWSKLVTFFKDKDFLQSLENLVQHPLELSTATMWADLQGFGHLKPHKEQGGAYMMQIYITKHEHNWSGTTIYNERNQVLIQLPYRNNFGWFFHGQEIMHGRQHDVPKDLCRFTLQVWFRSVAELGGDKVIL
jgi:hypothetical protein